MEKIYRECSTCVGTGVETRPLPGGGTEEVFCIACNGVGKREYLSVDLSDIGDTLDDILEKVIEIKTVVDTL